MVQPAAGHDDLRNLNVEGEGVQKNKNAENSTRKSGGNSNNANRKSNRKKNAGGQQNNSGANAFLGGMQGEIQKQLQQKQQKKSNATPQQQKQQQHAEPTKTRPGQKLPLAQQPTDKDPVKLNAYTVRKHDEKTHAQDRNARESKKQKQLQKHGLEASPKQAEKLAVPAAPFSPAARTTPTKNELSMSRPSDISTYAGSLPSVPNSAEVTPQLRRAGSGEPSSTSTTVSDEPARDALYHNIGSNANQHATHSRRGENKLLVLTDHAAPWPTSVTPMASPKWRLRDFELKADFLIQEFFLSGDYKEFVDQVRFLRSGAYNDVLVARAFRKSLDLRSTFQADMAKQMIMRLVLDGDVEKPAFVRGIFSHVANLEDLELDVPNATEEILNILEEIVQFGRLERDIFYRLPENVLRRGGYTDIANEVRLFKMIVTNNVRDYLSMGNYLRFEANIRDLGKGFQHFYHEVVRKLITMSFDLPMCGENQNGTQTFRWIAKTIHKLLQRNILTDEDVQHGVSMVLGQLPDLQLDVPRVVSYFSRTLGYCIGEEVVTADLVKKEQRLAYGLELGFQAAADALRSTPEYSRKVWGEDGDERTLDAEMDMAIVEYRDSWDCAEVARIMGELHLNREMEIKFIRKIILSLCVENGPRYCDHGLYLVEYLMQAFGTQLEVEDAVEALRCDTDDLALDYPNVETQLSDIVERMEYRGLVSKEYRRMDAQYLV